MNVLELCLSPGLGGLELYVYRSAEALNDSESNNVIAVLSKNSKLDEHFGKNSSIPRKYIKRFFHALPVLNAIKLAKIIDANQINAIHMHWGKDLPLAAFAKAFSKRKPALVYTRQMMVTREKNDFYHNFLYGQLNLLLTITKELEGLYKKYIHNFSNKVITLYYGVKQPDHFLKKEELIKQRNERGFSANDFVVGLIGRLEESKGQHLLIEAIHKAKENNQNIKALIVGHEMNTGYRDILRKQANKLGIADNIKFEDFVNQPQQLMQICDCIALASEQETFGLVLPEAMRAGIAVIGSNSGGVPEIIDHEKTGLLFETKNSGDLYAQIEKLYLDPDFKHNLAQQGQQSADNRFNNTLHFQQLEKHLKSINPQKAY